MFQYKFNWAKKVQQSIIRQLYDSDAARFKDDKLIDEAGWSLYARCVSIVNVTTAYENKSLPCPICEKMMTYTDEFTCTCGLSIPWQDFRKSYKNKQLYGANALPVFVKFINNFPQCKNYDQKMIAIDTLINSFHILHSYRNDSFTDTPTESDPLGRPVADNLIEGTHSEVIAFLDYLSSK